MEKILATHTIASGHHMLIQGVEIDFGNTKSAVFEMATFNYAEGEPQWWVIICGYEQGTGRLILIQQFQVALGARTLLLPRGGLMQGKTSLESAQAEFAEETGYTSDVRHECGEIYASPGFFSQHTRVYVARDCVPMQHAIAGDEIEETIPVLLGPAEVTDKIVKGEIVDARTISAFFIGQTLVA